MKKVFLIIAKESSFYNPIKEAFEKLGWNVKTYDYRKGDLLIRLYRFLPFIGSFEKARIAIEEKILKLNKKFKPDLIYINKGETLSTSLFKKLKTKSNKVVNLFPEYLNYWDLVKKLVRHFDIFIVFDYPLLRKLRKEGYKNAYYIPFGTHIEDKRQQKKIYDISFVGTWRPSREERLSKLTDYNLNIWGDPRWAKSSLRKFVRGGRISQSKMKDILRSSKINLNIYFDGYKLDGAALRVFETTECGEFLISEYKPALEELYVLDKEIVCYKSVNELKQKIDYYLKHDNAREKIAKAGYKRAIKDHTWEKRLMQLFRIINF